MALRDEAASDLTVIDLVGVGVLAAPGFVLPPLLGPSAETLSVAVVFTAAAVGWVAHRSGVLRHRPAEPAAGPATAGGARSPGSVTPVP